jgi:hypothetical protein
MAPDGPAAGFAEAAAADAIELAPASFDWLSEQGHVGLERVAKARRDPSIVAPVKAALSVLAAIFARLGGDVTVLHAARENLLLPVQLVHEPSGTLVQLDELPHFTSFRLIALELYPADASLGFDIHEHKRLCREHAAEADGIGRGLAAKAFGFGGVPRERAYNDALLDLATPAMGHPPLVRVAVLDGDGAEAYARFRSAGGGAALAAGRRSPRR